MTSSTAANGLMAAIGFTAEDLQANRAGEIGPTQAVRLRRLQRRALTFGGAGLFLFAFVATGFLFLGQQNGSPILTLVGMLVTVLNAISVGFFGRQYMRLNADLRGERVETISGPVERVIRANGRANNFLIRVADETFFVSRDLFRQFEHETPHRLYRAPHSRVLLAAERPV